jgi:hypothetical protein
MEHRFLVFGNGMQRRAKVVVAMDKEFLKLREELTVSKRQTTVTSNPTKRLLNLYKSADQNGGLLS